jgi:hypothetical protein
LRTEQPQPLGANREWYDELAGDLAQGFQKMGYEANKYLTSTLPQALFSTRPQNPNDPYVQAYAKEYGLDPNAVAKMAQETSVGRYFKEQNVAAKQRGKAQNAEQAIYEKTLPQTRPEWAKGAIETFQSDPKTFWTPGYLAHVFAVNAAPTITSMAVGTGTTLATGNPILGGIAGAAVMFPIEAQSAYDTLIEAGASEADAAELAPLVGGIVAGIEQASDIPMMGKLSTAAKQVFGKALAGEMAKATFKELAVRGVKTVTAKVVGEIAEEVAQDATENAFAKIYDEDRPLFTNLGETVLSTAISTVPFALVGAGGEMTGTIAQRGVDTTQARAGLQRLATEESGQIHRPTNLIIADAENASMRATSLADQMASNQAAQKQKAELIKLQQDAFDFKAEYDASQNDPDAGIYSTIPEAQKALNEANAVLSFDPENETAIKMKDIAEVSISILQERQGMAQGTSVQTGLPGMGAQKAQGVMFGEFGGAPGTGGQRQTLVNIEQQKAAAEANRLRDLGQAEMLPQPVQPTPATLPAVSTPAEGAKPSGQPAEIDQLRRTVAQLGRQLEGEPDAPDLLARKGYTESKRIIAGDIQARIDIAEMETAAARKFWETNYGGRKNNPQMENAIVLAEKTLAEAKRKVIPQQKTSSFEAQPQPVVPEVKEAPKVETPPTEPPIPPTKPPVAEAVPALPSEQPAFTASEVQDIRNFWVKDAQKKETMVGAVKQRLYDVVKAHVPLPAQGRMLASLKNVKTGKQLLKALDFAGVIAEQFDQTRLRKAVYKELAATAPKEGKGKFTADIQRKLDIFRKGTRATEQTRQDMRNANSQAMLKGTITSREARERNHLINLSNIKDMSAVQMSDVLNQIKQFKATGKLVKLAEKEIATRARIGFSSTEDAVKALSESLPQRKVRAAPGTEYKSIKEKAVEKWDSYWVGAWRVERLLDAMDGYEDYKGLWSKTLFKPYTKAMDTQIRGVGTKMEELQTFYKENKLDVGKMATKWETVAGLKLRPTDKIAIYLHSLNEQNRNHLINGNKITEEQIDAVVTSLTDDEKKVAAKFQEMTKAETPEIAKAYEDITGVPLKAVENYWHIEIKHNVAGEQSKNYAEKLKEEDLMRKAYFAASSSIEKGFTQARAQTAAQEIRLDALGQMAAHIRDVEHYKAFLPLVKDFQAILADPSIKNAIINNRGYSTYRTLNKWLEDIAESDPYQLTNTYDRAARTLRVNSVAATLIFNLSSVMNQPVSFLVGAAEIGNLNAARGLIINLAKPGETAKIIKEYSPAMYARAMEREVAEARQMRGQGKISPQELMMVLQETTDRIAVNSLWRGAFDDKLIKGSTAQEAADYATGIIRRTQGWSSPGDVAAIARSGELIKAITPFTNEINQLLNYLRFDVFGKYGAKKMSTASMIAKIIEAFIAPALLFGLIRRGRLPKDGQEVAEDIGTALITMIPIFGPLIVAGLEGYNDMSPLALKSLEYMQSAASSAKKQNWLTALKNIGLGAGTVAGAPVTAIRRIIEGITAVAEGKSDSWRDFVYGTYRANQARKEAQMPKTWSPPSSSSGATRKKIGSIKELVK